jgi:hypothetical protein
MYIDPIVEEVRAIRAQRQVQFSGNDDLAYADLLRQRAELARQGLVFINPATLKTSHPSPASPAAHGLQ